MCSRLQKKNQNNLRYTRLIPFRVSQVSGALLRSFRQGPHFKVTAVASRWQRVRLDRLGI